MYLAEAASTPADADSAPLYRLIAETIPHMVWTARPDGAIDFLNSRAYEYTGLAAAELEGSAWIHVVHPQDREACLARWSASLASGEPHELECRVRRHDGAYRWHLAAARPLRDAGGRIVKWFGTCTDIDSHRQAAEREAQFREELEALVLERSGALAESEARFRSIMTLSSDYYWETDAEHRFTVLELGGRFSPMFFVATRLGRTRWEPPSVHPDEAGWRAHRQVLESREAFRDFHIARGHADGTVRHYTIDGEPVFDVAGEFKGYRGVGRNVTERRLAEDELRASAERIRSLIGRLVTVQEAERRKVAIDLHDLIGQKLTALGINLDIVRQALPVAVVGELEPRLLQMAALLWDAFASIREVMADLRPPMLDDHGLVPALHWYASIFQHRTGLPVRVAAADPGPRLDRELELALFRIAQEALSNVAKHSRASHARLCVEHTAQSVCLRVEDDGGGLEQSAQPTAPGRSGWGLPAMRERAQAFGGTLRAEGGASGFEVVVEVPVGDGDQRHTG